jgi:hypothetical protein
MIAPRVVPARPCPLGHPPLAWLDRDGDAVCTACRPPAAAPEHAGLPAGTKRAEAQAAYTRVERSFLWLLWPKLRLEKSPDKPLPPAWLVPAQPETAEVVGG